MAESPVPVLWLCGPAGVGKSTVSWQLFEELAQAGVRVAFADTDQLCMCYPAPPGDQGRERLKAQNIGAMIRNYQAAGAQCLVVNGVLDPVAGLYSGLMPAGDVMVCRLRASMDEVMRRFTERHGQGQDLDGLLQQIRDEVTGMDQSSFCDACVDTTGVPAAEVAGLVRAVCGQWPGFRAGFAGCAGHDTVQGPAAASIGAGAGGQVVLICGPTGVGKSTIGFELYMRCLQAGLTAGYIDLGQLGFLRPAGGDAVDHRLRARNLAAMWRNYHAAGATHLIATGPIENASALRIYAAELPDATMTVCVLSAGNDELTRRILSRGSGGSWSEPGDPLRGQPAQMLRKLAAVAAGQAAELGRAHPDWLVVDTDGRSPAEAAGLIGSAVGLRPSRRQRGRTAAKPE